MRTQLGNITAVPVTAGQRIVARLIIIGLALPGLVLEYMGNLTGSNRGSLGSLNWMSITGLIYALAFIVWQLVLIFKRSTNIGGLLLRFRYLSTESGTDAAGKLFLKYLVEGVLEIVTVGLVTISYLVSYRDGQHWLDRTFGLIAINAESIQQVSQQSNDPASAPSPRVMPVQMPQNSAKPSHHQQPAPDAPAPFRSGQLSFQPPQNSHSAEAVIQSFGQPSGPISAGPTNVPDPAPMRRAPTSNPWMLPEEGFAKPKRASLSPESAPAAPLLPSPASTSSGRSMQPPFTQHAPVSPEISESLLNDETVIDPDLAGRADLAVVLDDGHRISVGSAVVLGRNPSAPPAYPNAQTVRVFDESMRMSKSHLVLLPVDGKVGVYDVGATNGIHLEEDGHLTRLSAGEVHLLPEDAVLHFGGRSLQVLL